MRAEARGLKSRIMADVILRGVKKIYPHSKDEKKKVKKAGAGDKPSEDKAKLQVTEQGVIAVQEFNLEIKD